MNLNILNPTMLMMAALFFAQACGDDLNSGADALFYTDGDTDTDSDTQGSTGDNNYVVFDGGYIQMGP